MNDEERVWVEAVDVQNRTQVNTNRCLQEVCRLLFRLDADLKSVRKINEGLADRVATQSQLLTRRAEKP